MSEIKTGGPAFPCETIGVDEHGEFRTPWVGLSLRDYFAAKAMQSMCGESMAKDFEWCARRSYAMADAMLKARK